MPSDTAPMEGAPSNHVALGTTGRAPLQAASFVSSLLAERLASGAPLEQAETVRVQGALMLTDIEGWTARVQQLSGTGPEGLDELGRAMNSYAIDLAEIVYGYGGDVLAIAGDAFLCCWRRVTSRGWPRRARSPRRRRSPSRPRRIVTARAAGTCKPGSGLLRESLRSQSSAVSMGAGSCCR